MGNVYIGSAEENSRDEGSEEKQVQEDEKSNNNVYKEPPTTPGYIYIGGEQASIYLGSNKELRQIAQLIGGTWPNLM